jgi:hypothetical protein
MASSQLLPSVPGAGAMPEFRFLDPSTAFMRKPDNGDVTVGEEASVVSGSARGDIQQL